MSGYSLIGEDRAAPASKRLWKPGLENGQMQEVRST
jgi:hypothetical protein